MLIKPSFFPAPPLHKAQKPGTAKPKKNKENVNKSTHVPIWELSGFGRNIAAQENPNTNEFLDKWWSHETDIRSTPLDIIVHYFSTM